MKKILLLLLPVLSLALSAAVLDKGGVVFDFAKYSAERFKSATLPADNLITNADGKAQGKRYDPLKWRGSYCFLHTSAIPDKDPRRAQVKQMVRWSIENGVFKVVKPASLKKLLPPVVLKSTSGGWYKSVNLPHDKGGICRISFEYRTQFDGAGSVCMIASGYDQIAGKWGKAKRFFFKVHRVIPSANWTTYTKEIPIPKGCRSIQIVYRMDGVGQLEFRNPSAVMIAEKKDPEKINLQLAAVGFLDRTFALAQGLPGTMCFTWKRNGTPAEAVLEKPVLTVVLPKEITFYDERNFLTLLSKKEVPGGIEYRLSLHRVKKRPARQETFDGYLLLPMLLSSNAAPGTTFSGATAWVEDKNKRVSNIEKFSLKVIPSFKAVRPKEYLMGMHLGGIYLNHSGKNLDISAKLFKAAGVSWIISGHQPAFPAWRRAGVKVITPELFFIANGYKIGMPDKRPAGDKFRYIGDANKKMLEDGTCPSAVYEKRPYFMNSTVPYIRESLKGADGLWANWEPYMFAGRGCVCDTCCRKFAKFVGVSEEEMKKEWPANVGVGRKYRQQAVRFRSLEHAKLMRTVNEAVTAATGGSKSLGFVPGVQVDNMSSTWREHKFDAENHPYDYAKSFKWIDPWGPYSHWEAAVTPYIYSKIFSLRIFTKAREVRLAVNKDYPLPNRPKLLAFPHGLQAASRVTYPETLKLDLLTFFFNGWEGSTIYYFPKGYDARYWKVFADVSTIAAAYEDHVFKGKRVDEKVVLTPIQPYAADTVIVEHLLGRHRKFAMLQHTAFSKGDSLVAAVFNFWFHGEVFFNCKVRGLVPAQRYTVKCNGNRFVNAQGKSFTGRELAKGVMLHAGAVRCAIYEIAPEKAADVKLPALTPGAVEKYRKAALPALHKAKAFDDEYEKRNVFKESCLKDISNAGISCKADLPKNLLYFTSGSMRAEFNAVSCTVTAWEKEGNKLINGGRISGAGTPTFWTPVCKFLNSGFAVTNQKKIPGGLEVTCERRVDGKNSPALEGLYIISKIRFTDQLKKIAVFTTIVNKSDKAITFGFRYNVQPALPGLPGGFTRIMVKGKKTDVKRDNRRYVYATGKNKEFETEVRKLFEVVQPTRSIDKTPGWFISPKHTIKLTFEPLKDVLGVASWDGGSQQAPTFEPCFKKVTLLRMDQVTYSALLVLEK